MTLKKLLGLNQSRITEWEICAKIAEAQKLGLEEVDFTDEFGNIVKIHIPSMHFDPDLMTSVDYW